MTAFELAEIDGAPAVREHRAALSRAELAAAVVQLTVGDAWVDLDDDGWSALFSLAVAERCEGLIWLRRGAELRGTLPTELTERWRRTLLTRDLKTQRQLQLTREIVERLEAASIDVIVLKGSPLAVRLYGDTLARCSDDIDLYVPLAQRPGARAALRELGWRLVEGEPPWEEKWSWLGFGEEVRLEVHSMMTSDNLDHLPLPAPDVARVEIGDFAYPAAYGDVLLAYHAVHAAHHREVPLLWWIDYAMLRASLSPAARASAYELASKARVRRFVAWADRRADRIEAAVQGDARALEPLGFGERRARSLPPLLRCAVLSERAGDFARSASMWLMPQSARIHDQSFVSFCSDRARRALHRRRHAVGVGQPAGR